MATILDLSLKLDNFLKDTYLNQSFQNFTDISEGLEAFTETSVVLNKTPEALKEVFIHLIVSSHMYSIKEKLFYALALVSTSFPGKRNLSADFVMF